jgi:proteic killer suppression protein
VIQSFHNAQTAELFREGKSRHWPGIALVACRKLDLIHAAVTLNDLRVPPGNRLKLLVSNRKGQHSIRINDQYRICFVWRGDGAHRVEVTDYH